MRKYITALGILLLISFILHLRMLWYQWDQVASGSGDFVAYYTAGKILTSGNFRELADFNLHRVYQRQLALAGQTEFLPFYHAHYQALLFWPLSYFSYPVAHLIWSGLTAVLLACVFACIVPFIHSDLRLVLGLMLIATYPTWLTFVKGQDSIMSALIIVGVFRSLKFRRERLAGILLALGLYKPQLVLPMAGILVFGHRWQAAVSFVLTGFFLTVISVLMVSWNGAIEIASTLATMSTQGVLEHPILMANLRGLIYTLLNPLGVQEAITIVLAGIISLLLYAGCIALCRDILDVNRRAFDLKFSLVIMTTLLINPHGHAYELVLLSLALILLFNYILQAKTAGRYFRLSILAALFVFCVPVIPNVIVSYNLIGLSALLVMTLYLTTVMEIRTQTAQPAVSHLQFVGE
jgi:hypothetical protein